MGSKRSFAFLLMLLGILALPAFGADDEKPTSQPANFNGSWKWTVKPGKGDPFDLTLKLTVDGDKVTGSVEGTYSQDIEEAKIDGDHITFQTTTTSGDKKTVRTYDGKLDGDTIVGKTSAPNKSGKVRTYDWKADRVKDDAGDKTKDADKDKDTAGKL